MRPVFSIEECTKPRTMRLWAAFVCVLVLWQLASTALVARGLALTVNSDLISFVLMLSAALIFLRNAVTSTGRLRLSWYLLAACWGTRTIVQLIWMYFDIVLRQETPNPFVGDILLFLSNIPVLAALLLETQQDSPDWQKPQERVDFFLLLLWWLYLYLFFVIPWQYVVLDPGRYGSSYDRLNGLLDLALLLMLGLARRQASGGWKWFYGIFFSAQLFISISGYVANWAIDQQSYYPGSLYDLPYTAALAAFTVVGLLGGALSATEPVASMRVNKLPLTKLGVLALLSLPVITAWTVLYQSAPPPVVQFRLLVVLVTIFAMTLLLVSRQSQLARELARAADVLQEASVTDPLTGVRNRRFFEAVIPGDTSSVLRTYASSRESLGRELIFYLLDLDGFKEVNDHYGHTTGDKLLVEVTKRIRAAIRESDILVRWGGDEFLIVSRYSDSAEAETVASRILTAVGDPQRYISIGGLQIPQTCSIGWAAFPWDRQQPMKASVDVVLALADRGLYEAKVKGKNRAVGVSPSKSSKFVLTVADGDQLSTYPVKTLCVLGPTQSGEPFARIFQGHLEAGMTSPGPRGV